MTTKMRYAGGAATAVAVAGIVFVLASFAPAFIFAPYQKLEIRDFGLTMLTIAVFCGIASVTGGFLARNVRAATLGVTALALSVAFLFGGSYFRACCGSTESAAIAEIRTINTAEVTYFSSTQGKYGTIPELITAGLLDTRYVDAQGGYRFNVSVFPDSYSATATPVAAGTFRQGGRFAYASSADAVVRYSTDPALAPPGQASQPAQ